MSAERGSSPDRSEGGGLEAELRAAGKTLGLPLSELQLARLAQFLTLLRRWNATYNLTAIRDPARMLSLHLVDCLAVVRPLHRQLGAAPKGLRLLDVGSGAGLPGVVLAIAEPELEVTCVDAVGKKAAFVQQVKSELGLHNLLSRHSRVEDLPRAQNFNVVASRAFSTLSEFAKATSPLLAPSGVWMAMKGKVPNDEAAALPPEITFHVEQLAVPQLGAARCIVWMRAAMA